MAGFDLSDEDLDTIIKTAVISRETDWQLRLFDGKPDIRDIRSHITDTETDFNNLQVLLVETDGEHDFTSIIKQAMNKGVFTIGFGTELIFSQKQVSSFILTENRDHINNAIVSILRLIFEPKFIGFDYADIHDVLEGAIFNFCSYEINTNNFNKDISFDVPAYKRGLILLESSFGDKTTSTMLDMVLHYLAPAPRYEDNCMACTAVLYDDFHDKIVCSLFYSETDKMLLHENFMVDIDDFRVLNKKSVSTEK